MLRAVVTDYTFPDLVLEQEILGSVQVAVDARQCRSVAEVVEAVRDADLVITQFAPVNAEAIAAMTRARAIVRYGIGVDNVDLDAARQRDLAVCNVPDFCIDEVADHTLALILAATRQVFANAELVRQGRWGLAVPLSAMRSLKSQTVGVVGFGRIGRAVASRLLAFGCQVQAFDPGVASEVIERAGCRPASWEELLASSDIVTLHCPSIPATRGLIDSAAVGRMKEGTILVNVARGSVVRTDALLQGLDQGKIAFAALDVAEEEPLPSGHPLAKRDNVLFSSHIASASPAAVRTLRTQAATLASLAAQGKPLENIVNGVDPTAYLRRTHLS